MEMITEEIIIELKGCSKKQRAQIKDILLKNYIKFLDEVEKEADYCSVVNYWKDHTPISKPIIKAKTIISEYNKTKK